jgi:hypothetical protein
MLAQVRRRVGTAASRKALPLTAAVVAGAATQAATEAKPDRSAATQADTAAAKLRMVAPAV